MTAVGSYNDGTELKITGGHWPFSVQFSTMAIQNLCRWPIKISVCPTKPKALFSALVACSCHFPLTSPASKTETLPSQSPVTRWWPVGAQHSLLRAVSRFSVRIGTWTAKESESESESDQFAKPSQVPRSRQCMVWG